MPWQRPMILHETATSPQRHPRFSNRSGIILRIWSGQLATTRPYDSAPARAARLGLMRAGQARAALRGREFILPDDIKYLARPVLAHRLILKEEERLRGESTDHIIEELIGRIPVPAAAG